VIKDKWPHIPTSNTLDLRPNVEDLRAASKSGLDVTARRDTEHGWPYEPHSPVQNAMCKKWDTPVSHAGLNPSPFPVHCTLSFHDKPLVSAWMSSLQMPPTLCSSPQNLALSMPRAAKAARGEKRYESDGGALRIVMALQCAKCQSGKTIPDL